MKPEWGSKHECPECGAHFYDMRNPEAACPKCHAPVAERSALVTQKGNGESVAKPARKKDILDDFDDLDDDLELEDAEDDFIEDTSELVGSDESDMSEIMEHIDDGVADQNL